MTNPSNPTPCPTCGSDDPAFDISDNGMPIRRDELRVRMLSRLLCTDEFHSTQPEPDQPSGEEREDPTERYIHESPALDGPVPDQSERDERWPWEAEQEWEYLDDGRFYAASSGNPESWWLADHGRFNRYLVAHGLTEADAKALARFINDAASLEDLLAQARAERDEAQKEATFWKGIAGAAKAYADRTVARVEDDRRPPPPPPTDRDPMWEQAVKQADVRAEAAEAERDKLKEALERIAALSPYPASPESDPYQLGRDQGREDGAEIAAAALSSTPPEQS